ncbi:MAG: hypothetical protein OXI78_06400 [Anaerolineaceae bacterium]|nr:hypothetical protein [Anaerolineaceae bacterium]
MRPSPPGPLFPLSRGSPSLRESYFHFTLGMGAPVHVLQSGDDVEDIVAIATVAAMDAHGRGGG